MRLDQLNIIKIKTKRHEAIIITIFYSLSLHHFSIGSPDTVMHPALSKRMPMGGGVDCALYIQIH